MKDYKKILEGVVNIIKTTEKSDIGFANICTYIGDNCPELAESEDEKVRKSLIILLQHFCKGYRVPCLDFPVSYKDMLAWLEKQGEQKLLDIDEEFKVGKYFTGLVPCWVNAPSKLQPAHPYHGNNVVAIHLKDGGYRCCCVDDEIPTTFTLSENTSFGEGWKDRNSIFGEEDKTLVDEVITLIEDGALSADEKYYYVEKLKSLKNRINR